MIHTNYAAPDFTGWDMARFDAFLREHTESSERSIYLINCTLAAMDDAGLAHALMKRRIFQHYRAIATGKLSVTAMMALIGNAADIEAIKPMPIEWQERIAAGEKVKVVTKNAQGRLVHEDQSIFQMAAAVRNRAFGANGIRSIEDQGHMLNAERQAEAKKERPRIRFDAKVRGFRTKATLITYEDWLEMGREAEWKFVRISNAKLRLA